VFLKAVILLSLLAGAESFADEVAIGSAGFDLKVKEVVSECRREVVSHVKRIVSSKSLTVNQLFDTFYIPIPNTDPQKFQTAYDRVIEPGLRSILDRYLELDHRIIYVVAVDRNGYAPTHNSKFCKPLTNDPAYNIKNNRAKRMFNDRTGLAAAQNRKPFLLQRYNRDTGEEIFDLSTPILIDDRHWGAVRVGYVRK
jgi:hypothetical protein